MRQQFANIMYFVPRRSPTFTGPVLEEEFLRRRSARKLTVPSTWLRYIDDVLMIWEGSMETLDHFLSEIDAYHYLIHFSSETGQDKVDFLDLSLFKGHRFRDHNILDPLLPFYPSPTLPTLSNAHSKLHHIRTSIPHKLLIVSLSLFTTSILLWTKKLFGHPQTAATERLEKIPKDKCWEKYRKKGYMKRITKLKNKNKINQGNEINQNFAQHIH